MPDLAYDVVALQFPVVYTNDGDHDPAGLAEQQSRRDVIQCVDDAALRATEQPYSIVTGQRLRHRAASASAWRSSMTPPTPRC